MTAGGVKYDTGKTRWDLLPYDALEEVARVLTIMAARKYAPRNWELGIPYSSCASASLRHHLMWWQYGETLDAESGCHHLAHKICNDLFMLAFELREQTQLDDRPMSAYSTPSKQHPKVELPAMQEQVYEPHNPITHALVWLMLLSFCVAAWGVILYPFAADAEPIEVLDMLSIDLDNRTPTNVVYWSWDEYDDCVDTFQSFEVCLPFGVVSEVFNAPFVEYINNAPVQYVSEAAFAQQGETFDSLPTYGLARWHWWLFGFVLLPEAQKQYAACVGSIEAYQTLLDDTPLISVFPHPAAGAVQSIRQYQVPFDALQNFQNVNLPPTREDAIAHARAGLASYNLNVFHLDLCQQTLEDWKRRVQLRVNEVCDRLFQEFKKSGKSTAVASKLVKDLEACKVIAIGQ